MPGSRLCSYQPTTVAETNRRPAGYRTGGEGSVEGSEGSGEHGEGSGEGGSESGGESGAESNPAIPIDQVATGTFNSLDFNIAYDPTTKAFRGVVTNNTNQTVCGSRLEIHISANGQVIELGPTIGQDLAPGETLTVVLSTARSRQTRARCIRNHRPAHRRLRLR